MKISGIFVFDLTFIAISIGMIYKINLREQTNPIPYFIS